MLGVQLRVGLGLGSGLRLGLTVGVFDAIRATSRACSSWSQIRVRVILGLGLGVDRAPVGPRLQIRKIVEQRAKPMRKKKDRDLRPKGHLSPAVLGI